MGQANIIFIRAFILIWALLIIPDYFFNHAYYGKVLSSFGYYEHLIFTIAGFTGYAFWRMDKKGNLFKNFSLRISGWTVLLGIMVSSGVLYALFHNKLGLDGSAGLAALRVIVVGLLYSLAFLFLIVSSFAVGHFLMKKIGQHYHLVSRQILSIALGFSILGMIVMLLGMVGFLNPYLLWLLFIIPIGWQYKAVLEFLQSIFIRPVHYKKLNIWKILPLKVLSIFLATGFLSTLKTFPIGFDGSGVYMNTSSLIASYGSLPEGGQPFNWSIIMSLGEIMFGQKPISILISHFTVLLALVVIYRLARLAMTPSRSWVAMSIFFAIPAIVFQTVREEKTDFGLLFMVLAAFLLIMEPRFKKDKNPISAKESYWIWGIAGWIMGFAFGIKVLALYGIVALVSVWAYRQWGKFGAFGALFLSTALLFQGGLDQFAYMDLSATDVLKTKLGLGFAGLGSLGYGWLVHGKELPKKHLTRLAIFIAMLALPILPWMGKHVSEHGKVSLGHALKGKSPTPSVKGNLKLYADYSDLSPLQDKRNNIIRMETDSLPDRQYQQAPIIKKKKKERITDSEREEIKRYIGYEKGHVLYHTIPYDATMGSNIPDRPYIDISFLFLLFIPLLLFRLDKLGIIPNMIYLLFFATSLVGIGWVAHYIPNGDYSTIETALQTRVQPWTDIGKDGFASIWAVIIENILLIFQPVDWPLYEMMSSMGFYITPLIMVLLTMCLWWMNKDKFSTMEPAMKEMAVLMYATLFLWMISANNIPWYGFPTLALACIFIAFTLQKSNWISGVENDKFVRYFFSGCIGLFFISSIFLRQSNPELTQENTTSFIDPIFIQQAALGKSDEQVLDALSPVYNNAFEYLNNDLNHKIYRVGTYLNYHIEQNDARVYEDNQLKLFDFYEKRLPDTNRFIELLKQNGFKYIIYDFRTPLIDNTPEKTLQKKCDAFVGLLLYSNELDLIVTDRIIQSENPNDFIIENGNRYNGMKYGLLGGVEKRKGTFAIYQIK